MRSLLSLLLSIHLSPDNLIHPQGFRLMTSKLLFFALAFLLNSNSSHQLTSTRVSKRQLRENLISSSTCFSYVFSILGNDTAMHTVAQVECSDGIPVFSLLLLCISKACWCYLRDSACIQHFSPLPPPPLGPKPLGTSCLCFKNLCALQMQSE